MGEGGDGHELRGLAGGGGDGGNTTFKGGDALLEGVDCGLNGRRVSNVVIWFDGRRVETSEK